MGAQLLEMPLFKKITGMFHEERSVLGIDIGTSSIKLVQVREEKGRALLETYGELSTGAFTGVEDGRAVALEEQKVAEMIADLKSESDGTSSQVFLSIPLRYSFVTLIDLPEMPESELISAVPFEARKYIPLPPDSVELEWYPVIMSDEERELHQKKIPILLAASQKEVIERYKRVITKAGLKPKGTEIEIFSTTRSIISRFRTPILVVDIGASSTKITVIDSGSIRAAFGTDNGSQALTLTLSKALQIDFARAERMKKETGIVDRPETAEMRKTILPFVDNILNEGDRLRAFYRKKTSRNVDKILFTGGGARLPGLVEYATEHYGLEVILASPFNSLDYPSFMQPIIKEIAPSFAVAIGLAVRGLRNLK